MISTHVLDTSRGRPAAGVAVTLERDDDGTWVALTTARTNADGRVPELLPGTSALSARRHRLVFDAAGYFAEHHTTAFFPTVCIEFDVRDVAQHYHVPLLLSPFGYTTYRGS